MINKIYFDKNNLNIEYSDNTSNKKKILCLHGGGETSTSFQNQAGMIDIRNELSEEFEFVFANSPSNNNNIWFVDGKEDSPISKTQLVNESITILDNIVDESFYGILGYSQGAAMAMVYLAHLESNSKKNMFEKILLFNGYLPTYNTDLIDPINNATNLKNASNLICTATNDNNFYNLTMEFEKYFTNPFIIISNEAGHSIPIKSDIVFPTIIEYIKSENTICLENNSIVNIISNNGNKYVFNNETTYNENNKYGLNTGYYVFKNIPELHPMALLNNDKKNLISYSGDQNKKFSTSVNNINYDFYYGDINVNVMGNFTSLSVYCYYHGYMGGENLLKYSSTCPSYSAPAPAPAPTPAPTPEIEDLNENSIVKVIYSNGNKYVFNGKTKYNENNKYYLSTRSYVFKNVPQSHPIAILNHNNTNITYSISNNTPIIINVSGGSTSPYSSGDYYIFKDSNNKQINIKNGDYKFMIGKTYEFVDDGISSIHPFKINNQSMNNNYNKPSLKITINPNTTYTYKCNIHSSMSGDLSLYNKTVTNTTNNGNYNFYYGDVNINVNGDFNEMSVYCFYHGYMGGKNIFKYKD